MNEPKTSKARILIVDDESAIIGLLIAILSPEHDCSSASSAEDAISLLNVTRFDLVISDISLGGMTGIELISGILSKTPDTVTMLISGDQAIETPIEALRVGAFDYIKKPFDLDQVKASVDRALAHGARAAEKRRHEDHLEELVAERTEQLNHLTLHDSLTGLDNRASFEESLSRAFQDHKGNEQVAALVVAFNGLSVARDRMGEPIGTNLIRELAERLVGLTKSEVGVARIDSYEFAVLSLGRDRIEIAGLAQDILKLCDSPFIGDGYEVSLSANVGISVYPEDGLSEEAILKNAGAALAHSREKGTNKYQFYTVEIRDDRIRRSVLENDLRHAVEKGELELLYQPKIDAVTQRVTGMEALVRWNHPILGRIPPSDFIPLAEQIGIIGQIGEWVLRAACSQCKLWIDKGFDLEVAVNLSPLQFQNKNLLDAILGIVGQTGMDPRFLNLEITESVIMNDTESAAKVLRELRDNGIKVSIDDFGTGHSSLSYLKSLPFDVLKIDKSFVIDMVADQVTASLVITIIALAHNLGLKVVAEGVQTQEQLRFLQLLRCDEWQGYLFSPPVSSAAFENLLTNSAHDHSVAAPGAESYVHDEIVRLSVK